jgi:predicted GH43/DUF377 family glycosyl hydrolase
MNVKLIRSSLNPIIQPRPGLQWEGKSTTNPGVVRHEGVTHILYRAIDERNRSSLGLATTLEGENILERTDEPVFAPTEPCEEYGCEDPRITMLEGTFYMLYTAYSRIGPRIAAASTSDFRSFTRYGIVGPDYNDKDSALFPERINGRLAAAHRIEPNIEIAFFDHVKKLDRVPHNPFSKGYLKRIEANVIMKPEQKWEAQKVGIGPPPIRTDVGWLVIYHGVDANTIYRAGAALLDLENPCRVISRTPEPILEPEMDFERVGVVPNVVFPEGAVVQDGQLMVYYGAGDRVCCVAHVSLKELMESLEG